MVRHPIFYTSEQPPRIAVVKIDNNTNQYLFSPARNAYVTQLRTQLKRALKDRVVLVDPQLENRIRSELVSWYPSDDQGVDTSDVHGADYLLTARFDSLNKVVSVADEDGKPRDKQIVELQMTFSLVDAESAELVWQNDVSSAAVFTTRDFQN
jgi:hypothetical protein